MTCHFSSVTSSSQKTQSNIGILNTQAKSATHLFKCFPSALTVVPIEGVVSCARRILCRDRACRSALAAAAEMACAEALSLWRFFLVTPLRGARVRKPCGDRACQSALAAALRESALSAENPLQRSCVSKRSCCGAVQMCLSWFRRTVWRCAIVSWSR